MRNKKRNKRGQPRKHVRKAGMDQVGRRYPLRRRRKVRGLWLGNRSKNVTPLSRKQQQGLWQQEVSRAINLVQNLGQGRL